MTPAVPRRLITVSSSGVVNERHRYESWYVNGVGAVSTLFGLALAIAPARTAAALGWGAPRARCIRALGIADLGLGAALLTSGRPARWMITRAALNAGLAGVYWHALRSTSPTPRRALTGLVALSSLTVADALAARWLRRVGCPDA